MVYPRLLAGIWRRQRGYRRLQERLSYGRSWLSRWVPYPPSCSANSNLSFVQRCVPSRLVVHARRGRVVAIIPFIFVSYTSISEPERRAFQCRADQMSSSGQHSSIARSRTWSGPTMASSRRWVCSISQVALRYISARARQPAPSASTCPIPFGRSRKSSERTPSHLALHRPQNTMCQLLALVIIWSSWLAFDAGTTLSLNFKSVMAFSVTNLCASSGALTWACITYLL